MMGLRSYLLKEEFMYLLMGIAFFLNVLFILFLSYILPGVRLYTFFTAILLAILLGVVNGFSHYLLKAMALPHNYLSYTLLSLMVSVALFSLATKIIPGLKIDGWGWLISFSILVALFNGIIHILLFQ